jgi:ribose 5-phosphate isomerase B
MRVLIASDHGGYERKEQIKKMLKGYEIVDLGTNSIESVDYPDFANDLCNELGGNDLGILICKTGIGMSIAANRHDNVRAAKVCSVEEASLARLHNNANVLALGALTPWFRTKKIVNTFLTTEFSNEKRHIRRINKIHGN